MGSVRLPLVCLSPMPQKYLVIYGILSLLTPLLVLLNSLLATGSAPWSRALLDCPTLKNNSLSNSVESTLPLQNRSKNQDFSAYNPLKP